MCMAEPHDGPESAPPPDDRTGARRAPYAALGVSGLVVSTVFATVAALASGRGEQVKSPEPVNNNGRVVISTETAASSGTSTQLTTTEVATTTPTPTTTTDP